MMAFRSMLVPLKAIVMNVLSIGASFGVVVAIFQWGWLGGLIGLDGTAPIESFLPVMVFAIVFGLSMDYEVFLMSRVHEEWEKRKDASEAVVHGLASTGRVITAAATIMICVFGSFALGGNLTIKLFGVALASAVFIDAFMIRSDPRPGDHGAAGQARLVAAGLARPDPAAAPRRRLRLRRSRRPPARRSRPRRLR